MGKVSLWLFGVLFLNAVAAETITLTVADLARATQSAGEPAESLQATLATRLRQALDEAGVSVLDAQAIYQTRLMNEPLVSPSCVYRADLRRLDVSVALPAATRVAIDLQNLRDPIVTRIATVAELATRNGRVEQETGLPWFNDRCLRTATYSFDVNVTGQIALDLALEVTPQVETFPTGVIRVTPSFRLSGQVTPIAYRVDVDDTLWASVLESALTRVLDDYLGPRNQAELIAELERDLYRRAIQAWGAPYVEFVVPELNPEQTATLYAVLAERLTFPVTAQYLADNQRALLTALFTGDDAALRRLLGGAATCDASRLLLQDLRYRALYEWRDGACAAANLRSPELGAAFADAACQVPVAFRPTAFRDYCLETVDLARHGNAPGLSDDPTPWTLWPAQQLAIGLVPTADLPQPFMTRLRYKRVSGSGGDCELEMRVFKPSPDARGLRPLLLLHGGSWSTRTLGVVAQEAVIAHYTERGFAVFAPFYRLTGEGGGSPSCTGVSGAEIEADVDDALRWVLANQARFGAEGARVTVSGQSAGGQLAAWLAVNRADLVERALLFYPPVDFADFLTDLQAGDPGVDSTAFPALERYVGEPLASLSPAAPVVLANSLPPRVAAQPDAFPPMFLVHGVADDTVPVKQSIRLCNALGGDPNRGTAGTVFDGFTANFACDARGSGLRLVAEGGHGLDACVFGALCEAGSAPSQTAALAAVAEGYDWLAQAPRDAVDGRLSADVGNSATRPAVASAEGGGAMTMAGLLGLGLVLAGGVRRRRSSG